MKFGPASPADAVGGVTVHTLRQGSLVLKKGTTISPAEVEALNKAGVKEVVVVRLEQGDVSEDVAAGAIAQAIAGDGIDVERAFTGRSNLFAARSGVLVVDRAAVDGINRVDEAITFATLQAFKPVVPGEMIATVKIVPFGIEGSLCERAVEAAKTGRMSVAPQPLSIFIVAAEESGDALGAALIRALQARRRDALTLNGVGGRAMAAAGVKSLFAIDELSIMGIAAIPAPRPI